jgi:hypothetical protein
MSDKKLSERITDIINEIKEATPEGYELGYGFEFRMSLRGFNTVEFKYQKIQEKVK